MVDFKKLREAKAKPKPKHPRDIFNALPKPPGINDLYASQAEVLDAWFARWNDKDIVVKLHTGGGKTLVALLMAQSVMNQAGEPVLYLAPTNQLVEQVLAKSKEYGIAAAAYQRGQPLPSAFHDGTSVLVGTYETLFNGRSKFGVRNSGQEVVKVGAIVLDDAHVALSSVRDAFTLTISAKNHGDVYTELADRFRSAFREVGRGGSFSDIVTGKEFGVAEVPSWAWQNKLDEIQQYLAEKVDDINPFVWPFLRDNLGVCHCLFSRTAISITPIFPPVDLLPTFDDAPRRIYMSATIADDSEILRTFGASRDAIGKPVTSTSLAGVGERMILVPGLMKLGNTPVLPMVKYFAQQIAAAKLGVAVLSPSGPAAKQWTDIAEYPDTTKAVSEKIAAMQMGATHGPVVLANRYDGIDLAGNACRFLVMDDLPQGTSNYDVFRMNVVADAAVSSLLAQRIEQGIGRGTRGGADYCVIVLVGSRLVGWIGRKKNLDFLTASTRVQLKIGQEVSEAVSTPDEFRDTILKCLRRDADWVAYHASELTEAARATTVDKLALKVAASERRAFRLQRLGQYEKAILELETLLSDEALLADGHRRAWLAASAARVAYQMGDANMGQKLQTTAFAINNNHSPPRIRPAHVARPSPGRQAHAIVARMLEYDRRTALLADFEEAVSDLVPEASATRYEQGLAQLGAYLGFDVERPEKVHGVGPDVLWRTEATFDFVIEAKSEKEGDNPLYKKDHAQLLEAEHWFKQVYPGRGSVRVSALPEAVADEKATPVGSFAFRLSDVTKVVSAIREVLRELVGASGDSVSLRDQCEAALVKSCLKPSGLLDNFMKPFGKGK
ncbi:DEAD/DEAH box helicase [Bradyrhizobium yuanmingense]|uniref:DEAD/DEAH box helicase n=1 Tax=Bradyrhizobium yuanmingense TaxID=108015 RepID=UPI001CD744DD|nr:DEAD/DEAH box helicase [Bradyrhizobium yuanmingense]MCA1530815.1 DEAD/DEAH box helicase [Bradyrhizobium yuanmingense]